MSTSFRSRRPVGLLAGVSCVVLLAACGGDDGESSEAGDSSAEATTSSSAPAEPTDEGEGGDLAAGLLPDDAFGPEVTVVEVSREQLAQGAGLTADSENVEITPESCAGAVEGTQPDIEDFDDAAGLNATDGVTTIVEVLLEGEETEGAADQLAASPETCPEATISSPQFGEATVAFEAVATPDLGDGAAVVRYVTTLEQNGTEVSIPTLVGVVEDGDRAVTLLTLAADGSEPDEAEFLALLERAYEVQAEQLG
jgi:hypothetical protein